jgi:hypothetical protein
LSPIALFIFTLKTYAVCPVCTLAVGAGLVLAEKYGIDNTISGVWIGGFTISLIMWTLNWLHSRKYQFKGMEMATAVLYFALVPLPLYLKDMIGHPALILWGMDKLILGMVFGGLGFIAAVSAYESAKKKNGGRPHFPYEKIAFPVGFLLILSLGFYWLTK